MIRIARLLQPKRHFSRSSLAFAKIDFLLADIGEGITECELVEWFVKKGDHIHEFGPLCSVQSDKAQVDISSRYTGTVSHMYYSQGDVAIVGKPLVQIDTGDDVKVDSNPSESKVKSPVVGTLAPSAPSIDSPDSPIDKSHTLATPAVRSIAKKNLIDLSTVVATGPNNRILKGDLIAHMQKPATPTTPSTTAPITNASTLSETLLVQSPVQKAMFKQMTKSLAIPHFGYSEEISIDQTHHLKTILGTTFMPIFIKSFSTALLSFPILNARVCPTTSNVYVRTQHHIGIAVDTPRGYTI